MRKCFNCNLETRNPKFCSKSCAAKTNNIGIRRHGISRSCLHCSKKIEGGKFCSLVCFNLQKEFEQIEKFKLGKISNPTALKKYAKAVFGEICAICGIDTWMNKPVPLVLDHIDGNSDHNAPENLRLVCGNCDMQLPTYKSKNKASETRRMMYRKSYRNAPVSPLASNEMKG